jgi:hypothetical protein
MRHFFPLIFACLLVAVFAEGCSKSVHLFSEKGVPQGWSVVEWNEISKPAPPEAKWAVDENGILQGTSRGTWLISEKQYGDFELELEFKLPPTGNSGVALRAPMHGDPAYDGMELQIVDPRYYGGKGEAAQLCGSIYRGSAPMKSVFKPDDWNKYQITCRGPHVKVILNGEVIQDLNLDEQTKPLHRDSPEKASPPLKDRPRRGHIGFQELSQKGHVQIRNVTLRVLD